MTFEQYFSEWLANYLQTEVNTELTPQSIAVILSDKDTSRVFLTETGLTIDCIFEKKIDAARWSQTVANAMQAFQQEDWISRVFIGVETASPKGMLKKWQYTTVVSILHKTRSSW